MKNKLSKEVDAYIAQFPASTQIMLQSLRNFILKIAPNAEEIISYKMPAYKINTVLVYFAGYKNHIGFYPTGSGISAFQKEIAAFKNSKGAVQFELNKKLPFDLIQKMVLYRVQQDELKSKSKQQLKTCKNGHTFYKSSDCPTCPKCEELKKSKEGFLSTLSAPAQRALNAAGISNLKQLAKYSEKEILNLHGMGPSSIPKLKKALNASGLSFMN
jgi:uncharacterized protein YdhG (YjbR/CyaY superfamily)